MVVVGPSVMFTTSGSGLEDADFWPELRAGVVHKLTPLHRTRPSSSSLPPPHGSVHSSLSRVHYGICPTTESPWTGNCMDRVESGRGVGTDLLAPLCPPKPRTPADRSAHGRISVLLDDCCGGATPPL